MQRFSTQYFGSKVLYKAILNDVCELEQHEHYQKRSLRNRCNILGSNGKETLSIPLKKGKNNKTKIKEVEVSYDENWMRDHIESIKSAYGSSAFLEYYLEDIKTILYQETALLWDLNWLSMTWVCKQLDLHNEIRISDTFAGAIVDLDVVTRPEYGAKKYSQVFEYKYGYVDGLSILDLLFCMGPEAKNYI